MLETVKSLCKVVRIVTARWLASWFPEYPVLRICGFANQSSYVLHDRRYRVKGAKFALPNPVLWAWDSNGKSVLKLLREWMGPANNFHGIAITPHDMELDHIAIQTVAGKQLSFRAHETIVL